MTEDVNKDNASDDATDKGPKLTPIQEKALEQGWKPKEQFEGEADEFIDAPEFVRRGELFGKIENQSRELKAVRSALEALKSHQTKIAANEYERAIKALKSQRREAIVDGDTAKAFELEDQIDEADAARDKLAREAARPAVQELNPEFVQWTDSNKWYTTDRVMRAAADAIGIDLAQSGKSPSEVLKEVEKEIRKAFPQKFQNQRARPGAVDSPSRSGSSREGAISLSEDETKIMNKLVAAKVITKEQYIADLKKIKESSNG